MDVHQSALYAKYLTMLHWDVVSVDATTIFMKRFPIFGGFAKIQRAALLPPADRLLPILKKYRVKRLSVEPDASTSQKNFSRWIEAISPYIPIVRSPYLPTKTICIDLTAPEETLFNRFSEAKRRAVRRALKHRVLIRQSHDIHELITVKNKSSGFLGCITTAGIDKLWQSFTPRHAAILLAYHGRAIASPANEAGHGFLRRILKLPLRISHRNDRKPVGAVLLLFWDKTAYYWVAGATKRGKRLFAPTLLVWEALKLAKRRGCNQFDFAGVWDERLPTYNTAWKGYSRFKEGFGGKPCYYALACY